MNGTTTWSDPIRSGVGRVPGPAPRSPPSGDDPARLTKATRVRIWLRCRPVITLRTLGLSMVALALVGCETAGNPALSRSAVPDAAPSVAPVASTLTSATVETAGPSDGISESDAIRIARDNVSADSRFVSAEHGRFADVFHPPGLNLGALGQADLDVWAVRFDSSLTICPPDGSGCFSPTPGTTTVILDYHTGEHFHTYSQAPAGGS